MKAQEDAEAALLAEAAANEDQKVKSARDRNSWTAQEKAWVAAKAMVHADVWTEVLHWKVFILPFSASILTYSNILYWYCIEYVVIVVVLMVVGSRS